MRKILLLKEYIETIVYEEIDKNEFKKSVNTGIFLFSKYDKHVLSNFFEEYPNNVRDTDNCKYYTDKKYYILDEEKICFFSFKYRDIIKSYYIIFKTKDDYFYVLQSIHEVMKFFRCDGIEGIIEVIKK